MVTCEWAVVMVGVVTVGVVRGHSGRGQWAWSVVTVGVVSGHSGRGGGHVEGGVSLFITVWSRNSSWQNSSTPF